MPFSLTKMISMVVNRWMEWIRDQRSASTRRLQTTTTSGCERSSSISYQTLIIVPHV